MADTTDLFGIPVPSTDEVFLAFVVMHILVALVAVVSGVFAMFSEKTGPHHIGWGRKYYWAMALSFVLVVILSVMRWPHNVHLLTIGMLAFGAAHTGREMVKRKVARWPRIHTVLMGMSYIFLLTGFYVDNGKHLPFWKLFPEWFFYVFPAMVGVPIIRRVLKTHPLNKRR